MRFVTENTDKELVKLNESLRPKFKKGSQPTPINLITQEHFLELLNSNADPDFKKSHVTDVLWREKFLENTTIMRYHITKLVLR